MGHDFSRYGVYGDVAEKAEALHNLTVEYRDAFLKNKNLQNLLLNDGYPMDDDDRPKSFHAYHDAIWHRSAVSVSLLYLDHVIGLATGETNVTNPGVRQLRCEWPMNMAVADFIRRYHEKLTGAFDEFNLQHMLTRMHHASLVKLIPEQSVEEIRLNSRISELWDGNAMGALDSAYYRQACVHMKEAGEYWNYLNHTRYGKFFILSPEEILAEVARIRRR